MDWEHLSLMGGSFFLPGCHILAIFFFFFFCGLGLVLYPVNFDSVSSFLDPVTD